MVGSNPLNGLDRLQRLLNLLAEKGGCGVEELATAAGLDAQKISACSTTPETEARIKKSMALGESLDVNSTPSVFINGRMVPAIANIPYEQLKALVQFEIDHAGK